MAGHNIRGETERRLLVHGILVVLALAGLVPFVVMILMSFKPLTEVESVNPIPTVWLPQNYTDVFRQVPFGRYYFNSVFISAWSTLLLVLTSSMAAFAFSRMKWPGRDLVFQMYLATLMIPGLVTMVPNFALMVNLRLLDSYVGLILPGAFSAFGTFLLRQFMLSVHPSLDESAMLDGATPWQIFWDVVMPLAKPGLVTLGIFTFMGTYGSFLWPLIMVKSQDISTLPIGMLYFDSQFNKQTNVLMAASVMNIVPLIVIFLAGQKFFVKGIMLGAVKG
jgi:ABC-type glycerol-3-phosphate transport system permease component